MVRIEIIVKASYTRRICRCLGETMVMPQNLLEKSIGKKVKILLKDGRSMEGTLSGYDEYMNMVLEGTEEEGKEMKRRLGTVVLRGNNVVSISPQ